jgi:two-component system phosphate regulon sensor histidine kinase PhoR
MGSDTDSATDRPRLDSMTPSKPESSGNNQGGDIFEAVLEEMVAGIIVVEANQRIMLSNRAARSLLELEDNIEGELLLDVLRVPAAEELLAAARSGRASRIEFELPGSVLRIVEARSNPQPNTGRIVLVLLDVTEARLLEKVRRDFVTNVSHELRTPVTVIRTNAETLLGGARHDPTMSVRFLEGIQRHSERLSALLEDLLDLSRIEAGQKEMHFENIPLVDFMNTTVEGLTPLAEKRKTTLSSRCAASLEVFADPDALDQILGNLTENAIKYSGIGSKVELRARKRAGGTVLIEICDNGIGIPAEHHPRLFERFYRVDKGRSRQAGGTGLGLSIVRHLAESMGGVCGYRANRPSGSIFWIELAPASPPHEVTQTLENISLE